MFNLKMDKRGVANQRSLGVLVSVLILVVLVGALGPTIFGNLTISGAPAWVSTVLPVIVGAGMITMVWRAFN